MPQPVSETRTTAVPPSVSRLRPMQPPGGLGYPADGPLDGKAAADDVDNGVEQAEGDDIVEGEPRRLVEPVAAERYAHGAHESMVQESVTKHMKMKNPR